jgi:hypothetical protein
MLSSVLETGCLTSCWLSIVTRYTCCISSVCTSTIYCDCLHYHSSHVLQAMQYICIYSHMSHVTHYTDLFFYTLMLMFKYTCTYTLYTILCTEGWDRGALPSLGRAGSVVVSAAKSGAKSLLQKASGINNNTSRYATLLLQQTMLYSQFMPLYNAIQCCIARCKLLQQLVFWAQFAALYIHYTVLW